MIITYVILIYIIMLIESVILTSIFRYRVNKFIKSKVPNLFKTGFVVIDMNFRLKSGTMLKEEEILFIPILNLLFSFRLILNFNSLSSRVLELTVNSAYEWCCNNINKLNEEELELLNRIKEKMDK